MRLFCYKIYGGCGSDVSSRETVAVTVTVLVTVTVTITVTVSVTVTVTVTVTISLTTNSFSETMAKRNDQQLKVRELCEA